MALPPEEAGTPAYETLQNAQPMTNSEVLLVLENVVEQKREKDPNYQPSELMKTVSDYVQHFTQFKTRQSADAVRTLLVDAGLREYEVGLIANLVPGTVEEAKALVPSLNEEGRFTQEEDITVLLDDIAAYRQFD